MKNSILINQKINNYKKKSINVEGDKSLSIRFVLLSSLSNGKSTAINLLKSEDVNSTIDCIRKLGIKINLRNKKCEVFGKGLYGFRPKNNLVLNAGNSGNLARLLASLLINVVCKVKITGDNSLKRRDMSRITKPLKKFGANIKDNKGKLPIYFNKSKTLKPIVYTENLGSAQCKSAIMLAALKVRGKTKLKCLPSRNHTELMFKNVINVPTKIKKQKRYDLIEVNGCKEFKPFKYKIPGDISSASFFIVLTLLSQNKYLYIRDININPSRTGIVKILNMMGARIKFLNKKKYKGEEVGDIYVESREKLKSINLNPKYNSSAIDELLLIFLVACRCNGISTFRNLGELNKKESKRLDWGIKILKLMGVKVKRIKNNGIKIWGKSNFNFKKKITIKNFLKDHRIFMVSVIAGLSIGGSWKIHNPDSFKTSFPLFLKKLKDLGAKFR